jgi:DNA-binding transcriptional regulator YdaS (Cro superfamily)
MKSKNAGVESAILKVGGQAELARQMKVHQPLVFYWLYKSLPASRALQINKKYDIPLHLLRPDLFEKK